MKNKFEKEEQASAPPVLLCDEVMDVNMLSEFIHLDKPTIYALTSQRRIPHSKPTGKLLFLKAEILEWLKTNRVRTVDEITADLSSGLKKAKP